jgi:hypothetical protein
MKQSAAGEPTMAKPADVAAVNSSGVKRLEEGYDSAATVSADETTEQQQQDRSTANRAAGATARPPAAAAAPAVSQQQQQQQQPVQRTIFVKDLMKTVIEQSLQPPANGGGSSVSAGRGGSNEIPNLKNMLQVAGPAPQHGNFVRGALAAAAEAAKEERSSMEAAAAARAGTTGIHLAQAQQQGPLPPSILLPTTSSSAMTSHPVPPPNDDGVLNLTTTRRERSPPPQPLNHHRPHVPPPPATGPPYAAHLSAVESSYAARPAPFVDYQTAAAQQQRANKEPPMAHGTTLAKTTHKETMYMDVQKMQGVYGDPRAGVHSPNLMVPRQDPRKDLMSHPKQQQQQQQQQQRHHPQLHGSGASTPGASASIGGGGSSKVMEGSITRGQPIPQGPSAQQQQQHAAMRYEKPPLNPVSQKGSLTTGTPVYTDHRRGSGYPPVGLAPAASAVDPHKKTTMTSSASPYPSYHHQRPPSGGLNDSAAAAAAAAARGSSSRSVIENDYKIAQSLPRKVDSTEELLRGAGYPRALADAHHMRAAAAAAAAANVGREVQIVDARGGDPRYAAAIAAQQQHHEAPSQRGAMLYGAPRVPNPYAAREPIRGDPRADIPPRDGGSRVGGSGSMVDSRPEYRADPRDGRLLDSRGGNSGNVGPPPRGPSPATYSPYDNRGAGILGMSREAAGAGRRSPPPTSRGLPSASTGGNRMIGLAGQQLASSPRPGSITSGLPRASVEIYNTGRQAPPDVSITKQPVATSVGGGGRLEYPLHHHSSSSSNNLSSLADIALQQPKMLEDPRGAGGATLTVTRADGGLARQQQQPLHPSDLARLGGKYHDDRATATVLARAAAVRQQQLEEAARYTGTPVNSEEYMKLLEQAKRAGLGGSSDQNALTAATLIDMIVTNQINQGSEALRNAYAASAAAAASGSRHSPHSVADSGKDSPGKQQPPRSSPSLRQISEEGGQQQHVRTSPAMIMGAPASLGDHIENMIAKEVQQNRTSSPYANIGSAAAAAAAAEAANEHWKRRQYAAAGDPNYAAGGLARPPSQGGGMQRPPSASASQPQLVADERQIIRVAQNASPHSSSGDNKPPSRSSMMLEPISPPAATNSASPSSSAESPRGGGPAYYYPDSVARFLAAQRKPSPHELTADQAAAAMTAAKNNPGGPAVFNYVKHKIAEAMKNDKPGTSGGGGNSSPDGGAGYNKPPTPVSSAMMGPPHTSSSSKRPLDNVADSRRSPAGGGIMESGSGNTESPRKRYKMEESAANAANDMPDSPGSPEMVIDESAGRPDSAHSHKTASPAPGHGGGDHPSYAYNRGGGSGPKPPPHSSPQQVQRHQQQAVAAGGQLGTGYDPLSDDD